MDSIRTDIAWSAPDSITAFGKDLPSEILGHVSFGDMAFLEITRRIPDANESRMFNAMLVTLVEHGLTPSTIAARLTYLGAPEAMQAAVAAGLSGLGSVFVGSTEGAAQMLYDAMPQADANADLPALAEAIVRKFKDTRRILPGIGHPFHVPRSLPHEARSRAANRDQENRRLVGDTKPDDCERNPGHRRNRP